MGFTSTITYNGVSGDERVTRGTYTSAGGSTGGAIDTGLVMCRHIALTPVSATAEASAPSLVDTLPEAGSSVTIITVANGVGLWEAQGY